MRKLHCPVWLVRLSLVLALASSGTVWAQLSVVTVEDAKATLLGAILDNTTWPNDPAIERFEIALYGADRALLTALRRDIAGSTVRNRPVSVTVLRDLEAARAAHVLVLAPSQNSRLAEVKAALSQSHTLLVTDGVDDRDAVMVNFTHPTKASVAFEINASNILAEGLIMSREMLLFGGNKTDVAAVYEDTQAKLAQARALAEEQQALLEQQDATIERQRAEVAANQQELAALGTQLGTVQKMLADSAGRLDRNAAELEEKERILAEKEAHIEGYSQRIERNLLRLQNQQQAIEQQERQIDEQRSVLDTQLSTIENQRFVLVATGLVLLLVLMLIGLILRAYRSKHRLAMQLEGKTLELGVANEKLVQLTEAKSRFLSTMSHEIRTPMNGVLGMAELLEGTSLTHQQREYVSLIIKSGDTLLGLINDILDFSKIEAGRLDLEAIPFPLRETLGDTLHTLALRANEKGLELTFHIPPEVPDSLIGDPLRLRQVMVNLVGNAIKFTEAGEVAVDLQLEAATDDSAQVRFEVRDTGIGISPTEQRKIFEAFDQADSSTTRRYGGTGLGLAISAQLVRIMGGELAVQSEAGQGSSFYFSMPFPLPAQALPLPQPAVELSSLRVLVVDDNSTNRMILEELLASWSVESCVVTGGEEALSALDTAEDEGREFAIALLDVMMPDMDGFELAAHIRQRPAQRAMRILMLTSAGREDTEALRRQLDISRILLKPVKHSDLQRAMSDALGISHAAATSVPGEVAVVAGRKVLLVEDNPVNRKVAVELLRRRGHQTEVASNGAEAVDAVFEQSFDIVLMDVHMPVMDGLTATRTIRERERGSGDHVPIVALTAGATQEDRENCLSAGMNGFVTKPFRAEELFEAVEGVAVQVGADTPQQPLGGEEPGFDWEGALRNLEGDQELLQELAEMFLDQYPAMLVAVEAAIADESGDELKRAAHSLKGSAQVVGGRAAAATALQLEQLALTADFAAAAVALQRLQGELTELKSALIGALPGRARASN